MTSRAARPSVLVAVVLISSVVACASPEPPTTGAEYARGRDIVVRALDAMGGTDAIERAGGLTLEGRGEMDLAVRGQGRSPARPESTPLVERLSIDERDGWLAFETDGFSNADAAEHLTYVYQGGERVLLADHLNRRAFWIGGSVEAGDAVRYRRLAPPLLLREALDRRSTLRSLGRRWSDARTLDAVAFSTASGEVLTLLFDADTGLLHAVETLADVEVRGDTLLSWAFDDYREVAGLGMFPSGYRMLIGVDPFKTVRWDLVSPGPDAAWIHEPPASIAVPEFPRPPPPSAPVPPSGPRATPVADGVFVARNVRGGFHPLIVEFEEFTLVTDAPTGWLELGQLPPSNWSPGESSSSVGRRLLEVAREATPGKPVRYIAASHHHSDHIGGVRPFVAAGATILGTRPTLDVVRRAVGSAFTISPDELTTERADSQLDVVESEMTLADDTMEVRLIDVGPNPHADDMLVVYLPRQRLLWVADLFDPAPDAFFPDQARLPVMRWFVNWLDQSGLAPDVILTMHGTGRVTAAQLDLVRDSGRL